MLKINSEKTKEILDKSNEVVEEKVQKDIEKKVNKNFSPENIEKLKDTVRDAKKDYEENQTITTDIPTLLHADFEEIDYAYLVNDLVNKSIDEVVEEKIREARQMYDESSVASALSTADAYYSKILNSQNIMTNLRDDFSKVLQQKSSDMINDKMVSLQNKIGHKWFNKILKESRLTRILTASVNESISEMVGAIISDKMIVNVSNDLIVSVNKLMKKSKDKFKDVFRNEIAYYKKVKKSIDDKIVLYKKKKAEYRAKLQAAVDKLRGFVQEQVKKLQDMMVTEISKFIKIDAGAVGEIAGGIF